MLVDGGPCRVRQVEVLAEEHLAVGLILGSGCSKSDRKAIALGARSANSATTWSDILLSKGCLVAAQQLSTSLIGRRQVQLEISAKGIEHAHERKLGFE